jgi:flagellar L-ring protein precursor FlgH
MRARSRLILACLAMPLIAGCAATAKESGPGSVDREILRAQRGGDGTLKELEAAREEVTKAQGANGDTDAGRRRRGSLWTDQQADMYLDNKARQVGDILRINLNEDIEGTLSADSQATREASQTREVGAFAGLTDLLASRIQEFDPDEGIETNSQNELEGSGEVSRDASLSGTVTAVVTKIFPNGNFRIRGQRSVTVNDERHHFLVSGIVRPQDISPDNVVPSNRVANARVKLVGQGVIGRQQEEGWMTERLHRVWPF